MTILTILFYILLYIITGVLVSVIYNLTIGVKEDFDLLWVIIFWPFIFIGITLAAIFSWSIDLSLYLTNKIRKK